MFGVDGCSAPERLTGGYSGVGVPAQRIGEPGRGRPILNILTLFARTLGSTPLSGFVAWKSAMILFALVGELALKDAALLAVLKVKLFVQSTFALSCPAAPSKAAVLYRCWG